MMTPMLPCLPTLLISSIYCLWGAYRRAQFERERLLRDRVAYMLWAAAHIE